MDDKLNPPFTPVQILPPKPGACLVCAAYHPKELPHNRDSIYYMLLFRQKHGRYPTWEDAAAHCTEDVKKQFFGIINSKIERRT